MTRGPRVEVEYVVWDGAAEYYGPGTKGQLMPAYDSHTNPLYYERLRINNPQAKSKPKGLIRCSVCRRLARHRGKCDECVRMGRKR